MQKVMQCPVMPRGQSRLYLTMVMSIAGALVSAFAVPLNPRDPTTVAVKKSYERWKMWGFDSFKMHLEDG